MLSLFVITNELRSDRDRVRHCVDSTHHARVGSSSGNSGFESNSEPAIVRAKKTRNKIQETIKVDFLAMGY